MKEQIHTIPVNEAFDSGDECPFCWLERKAEQSAIRYTVGPCASYMEPDVRSVTDARGFCAQHLKKLHEYGNTLGNALILQTHFGNLLEELQEEAASLQIPEKRPLFGKKKQSDTIPYWKRLQERNRRCYLCEKNEYNMNRYFDTFFALLKEPEFRAKVERSKGFCLHHFSQVMELAEEKLPNSQREWFYPAVYGLMEKNLLRVKEDLDWLIAKYDYRNADKPWGNSQDALKRAMQKMEGVYPADPAYKEKT